ncbi:MAG TPA: glycosyltransferase family 39 protein [Bryobacterales bacterium]|nr:glycosyltransferase family 39 protein [Bryobacterales bacterium]
MRDDRRAGAGGETLRRVALAALAVVFVARIVATYHVFNDTFDESGHIAAGLEILQTRTYTLEAQHPPLSRLVLAALPYYFAGLRLGHYSELWGHGAWATGSLAFYWKSLALARAGNLIYALLLLYFVCSWSARLYGAWAAVGACLLAVCSPNLIAHASLATIDLAVTATVVMAAYFFWRWAEEPGWRYCLAAAAAFALAVLSKFSALAFLPPIAVLYFAAARARRRRQIDTAAVWTAVRRAAAFCAAAFLIVWAGYLFEVGVLTPPGHHFISPFGTIPRGSAPDLLVRLLGRVPLPAHRLLQGVIELGSHNQEGHASYLLGHFSLRGWWYYFPVAVAVKTTLPLLILAAMGIGLWAAGRVARAAMYPLLAAAAILTVSMVAGINIGLRHVLPMYPFLIIAASGAFASGRRTVTVAALLLSAWHAGESIVAHPDYLAYFNEIARGREELFLADSNLDWGQDLARLGQYTREHGIDTIYLSYFGRSSPAKMGVNAAALGDQKPEHGWAAVSVSNLIEKRELGWLRDRQPAARVGKSIWVYELDANGAAGR